MGAHDHIAAAAPIAGAGAVDASSAVEFIREALIKISEDEIGAVAELLARKRTLLGPALAEEALRVATADAVRPILARVFATRRRSDEIIVTVGAPVLGHNLRDDPADVVDVVFLLRWPVDLVLPVAVHPHVDVEDVDLRAVLVADAPIARPDALDERDVARRLARRGPDEAVIAEHLLGIGQGDDVGVLVVAVHLGLASRVEVGETRRHDDRADVLLRLARGSSHGHREVADGAAAGDHGCLHADIHVRVEDTGAQAIQRFLGRSQVRCQGGVPRLIWCAAKDGSPLDEDRPGADLGDGPGRFQAGRSAADDEDGLRHLRPPRS